MTKIWDEVYDSVYCLKDLDSDIEGLNLEDDRYREVYRDLMVQVDELSNKGLDFNAASVERKVLSCDFDDVIEMLDSANPYYRTGVYDNPFTLEGPGM